MSSHWYFIRDGKKEGPVSIEVLSAMAMAQALKPSDMVLREGSSQWVAADSVSGLFMLAVATVAPTPALPAQPLATAAVAPKQTSASPPVALLATVPSPVAAPFPAPVSSANMQRAAISGLTIGGFFAVLVCGGVFALVGKIHKDRDQVVQVVETNPNTTARVTTTKDTGKRDGNRDSQPGATDKKAAEAKAERDRQNERERIEKAEQEKKERERQEEIAKQRDKEELRDIQFKTLALLAIGQEDKFAAEPDTIKSDMRRAAKALGADKNKTPELLTLEPTDTKEVPASAKTKGKKGLIHRYGSSHSFSWKSWTEDTG